MICFLVTTYNRPESCFKLVKELTKYGDVFLLNDGSKYKVNKSWISKYPVYYVEQEHSGKRYYNETVNDLWSMPTKRYSYYFMIPDDMLPVNDFVEKAIKTWDNIRDERKICLTTYFDKGRIGKPCWTKFNPVEYPDFRLTQWTDMCFMCKKKMFDEIGKIPRSKLDWDRNPKMSTGVGAYISSTLYKRGWNLYQTKTSLFVPQPEAYKSEMNPWRKKNDPINSPVL